MYKEDLVEKTYLHFQKVLDMALHMRLLEKQRAEILAWIKNVSEPKIKA